jgi:photoactive yellow protein
MVSLPTFDTLRLAEAVEALPPETLDELPFGAIYLDEKGIVRRYNKTRSEQSGRGTMPTVGLSYFADVAPCLDNGYFKGRIDKARAAGGLDISFSFIGDFADRNREIAVRAQGANDGGTWIFIQVPEQNDVGTSHPN